MVPHSSAAAAAAADSCLHAPHSLCPAPHPSAVPLPGGGGVGLLLRCRVYDGFQASAAAAPARGPAQRASPANGGRLYSLQQACLFHATSAPAAHSASASSSDGSGTALAHVQPALRQGGAEAAGAAGVAAPPLRLQWQGFLDMPGGGNRFTAK